MNRKKIYTVLALASVAIGLILGLIVVRQNQDGRNRASEQSNDAILPVSPTATPAQCPGDGAMCEWNNVPGVPGYCYRLEQQKDGKWVGMVPSTGSGCIPTQETKIIFRAEPGVQYRCTVEIDTPIEECENIASDSATLVCNTPSVTPPSGTVTVGTGTPGTGTPTGSPTPSSGTSTPTGSPTPSVGTGTPTGGVGTGTPTPSSGQGSGTATPTSGVGSGTPSSGTGASSGSGTSTPTSATQGNTTVTTTSSSNSSSNPSLPRAGFIETTLVLAALGLVVLIVGFTL